MAYGPVTKILIKKDGDLMLIGTEVGTLEVVEFKYESNSSLKMTTIHV